MLLALMKNTEIIAGKYTKKCKIMKIILALLSFKNILNLELKQS